MSAQELLRYINLFREKAELGKLVIFVGAGVSRNVEGMPSWNELIQKMAKAIDYSKCKSCRCKSEACEENCALKSEYSTDELLKIPQYVYNADQELYNRILKETFSKVEVDAPLSSAIFDINPAHIITTNYDDLLESSQNIFREQYQVVITDKDLLSAQKSKYIIKMHGDVLAQESIVLKEQDYLDYSQKHILLELFIKSLLTDHVVLFLGYSLNDYNIKLIISWLNYMRSQNGVLHKNWRVGYIVLDQEQVDAVEETYFSCNNIEVININKLQPLQCIPESLKDGKGQRLYSFLRIIADPTLDKGIEAIEENVRFMAQYTFVNREHLMKLLYVSRYEIEDYELQLYEERDFRRLITLLKRESSEARSLRQILINSGITAIAHSNSESDNRFDVGEITESVMLKDELYTLYLSNRYSDIKALIESSAETTFPLKQQFYQSIIEGYGFADEGGCSVDVSCLHTDQRVAYLHNSAVIECLRTRKFDSSKVKRFIGNMALSKERDMYSDYLDMYNGNAKKMGKMQIALEELKDDVCNRGTVRLGHMSHSKLIEIKRQVISEYLFYYNNYIFYHGLKDLSEFFRPYIEGVICANSDAAEKSSHFWGITFPNKKYTIQRVDIDIITKFISPKDLDALIKTYSISKLSMEKQEVEFLVECFSNLSNSLITAQTYGFRQSAFSTLSNLTMLLNLVELDETNKHTLKEAVESLLADKIIVSKFFSLNWPDHRVAIRSFSALCLLLTLSRNVEVIRGIIESEDFFNYVLNIDFWSIQQLFEAIMPKDVSLFAQEIVDAATTLSQKEVLLRLFYRHIKNDNVKKKYQEFLSANFEFLSTSAIYDFVFSEWLTVSREESQAFLREILEIEKRQISGMRTIPDPIETKLECVYLLYISGVITDISMLNELAPQRPHLQFLLDPENFDYTQVDFSNYMWGNFAGHVQFRKYFVANKNILIPQIKRRVKQKTASEVEKKVLYGILLDKDELWKE